MFTTSNLRQNVKVRMRAHKMRDFFRGWRRKVGVALLIVSCAFAAGWVRSLWISDQLTYVVGTRPCESCLSVNGFLVWVSFRSDKPLAENTTSAVRWNGGIKVSPSDFNNQDAPRQLVIDWTYRWPMFGAGRMRQYSNPNRSLMYVAYWSIVVPLILISAYLLLRTPREKVQSNGQQQ